MSAAPMKKSALPSTLRPVGSVPSSRSRRAVSIRAAGIDVEDRLGVGLVASLGIVAGEDQEVLDAERGGAHQFALQRDAVLVAAGELEHRLDAGIEQELGCSQRGHMGAGAGAVGDIDGIRQAFEAGRLAQQVRAIERHRRRDLRRHDETAVRPIAAKSVLECRGKGAANGLVVHYWLSFAAASVCSRGPRLRVFGTGRAAPTALI